MLARGVRNVIYNYTDAQRKVRSATSNDAWGPSPALMHEIADLTDNVVAYAEIMPIIWKRLNDHGKNWRHVYKSLVLLDHLIKYGNERVSQQCKENIFAIQTLKDFQYIEDQKDQGFNVREKAKQLVALLKDDERLRNERQKAQEARERYARQAMGMDSTGTITYGRPTHTASMRRNSAEGGDHFGASSYQSGTYASNTNMHRPSSANSNPFPTTGREFALPSNQEEEQLQMQIALAESQREAEDEERRRRNDELKLKIALERSVNETPADPFGAKDFDFNANSNHLPPSLFDTNTQHNDSYFPPATASNFGWNPPNTQSSGHLGFTTASNDPWASAPSNTNTTASSAPANDPWQIVPPPSTNTAQANPWSTSKPTTVNNDTGLSLNIGDPWGLGVTDSQTKPAIPTATSASTTSKTIDNELSEFFGANATISTPNNFQQQQTSSNPWNIPSSSSPFQSTTASSNTSANTGLNTSGNLLYPTIPGSNITKSNTSSPVPSALSTSRKTPESFLGENFGNLVNLDKLVTETKVTNPFGSTAPRPQNPFANLTKPPTLEQLSSSTNTGFIPGSTLPPPLIPATFTASNTTLNTTNPFM